MTEPTSTAEETPPLPGTQNTIARVTAWALRRTVVRAVLRYMHHRGPMLADSITYRALFSVFAAVLLGFSATALWLGENPKVTAQLAATINEYLPGLSDIIDVTEIHAPVGFSIVGVFSVVGLVMAALGAIGSLRGAFQVLSDGAGDEPMVVWMVIRNVLVGVLFAGLLVVAVAATWITNSGMQVLADWFGTGTDSVWLNWGAGIAGLVVALGINTLAILVTFALLSGISAPRRALWWGSLGGGVGLLVLQEFSALFVRGASDNPLLASFAVLVALLLWINLSCQVVLISASLIVTMTAESQDRVRERYGAQTFAQLRLVRAEEMSALADRELRAAQAAEQAERDHVAEVAREHQQHHSVTAHTER